MIRRIVDFILFFSFSFLLGSGIMLKFSFVKGMGPQTVLGLSKHEWCDIHLQVGLLMFIAVLIHLIVNRLWVTKVGTKSAWLAVIIALLGIALIAVLALSPTVINS